MATPTEDRYVLVDIALCGGAGLDKAEHQAAEGDASIPPAQADQRVKGMIRNCGATNGDDVRFGQRLGGGPQAAINVLQDQVKSLTLTGDPPHDW